MSDQFWRAFLRVNVRAIFLIALLALIATVAVVLYRIQGEPAQDDRRVGSVEPGGEEDARLGPTDTVTTPGSMPDPFQSPHLTERVRMEQERLRRLEEERLRAEAEAARRAAEEAARLAAEAAARKAAEEEAVRRAAEEEVVRKAAEEAARAAEAARVASEEEAARRAAEQAETASAEAPVDAPAEQAAAKPPSKPARPPRPPKLRLVYRGSMTRTDGVTQAIVEDEASGESVLVRRGDSVFGYELQEFSYQKAVVVGKDEAVHELPVGERVVLDIVKKEEGDS